MKKKLIFSGFLFWAFLAPCYASFHLDSYYKLQSLGVLEPIDNVQGILEPPVSRALLEALSAQKRFQWIPLNKFSKVLKKYHQIFKVKGFKDWTKSSDVLKEIAISAKVETLLKTEIKKSDEHFTVKFSWLHFPDAAILAQSEFDIYSLDLEEPKQSLETQNPKIFLEMPIEKSEKTGTEKMHQELVTLFQKELVALWSKVPFFSQINGHQKDQILTFEIDPLTESIQGVIQKQDLLEIRTLSSVQVHGLSHEIVDWQTEAIGEAQIIHKDGFLGVAEVTLLPDKHLKKNQKLFLKAQKEVSRNIASVGEPEIPSEKMIDQKDPSLESKTLGTLGLGLSLGSYSKLYQNPSTLLDTGSSFGLTAGGQVNLISSFFLDGLISYKPIKMNSPDVSGSWTTTAFAVGYTFKILESFQKYAGKFWLKAGLRNDQTLFPSFFQRGLGTSSFSQFFLGVGSEISVDSGSLWALILDFNYGLSSMVRANWLKGSASEVIHCSFLLGGQYRWKNNLDLKLDILGQFGSFSVQSGKQYFYQTLISIIPGAQVHF